MNKPVICAKDFYKFYGDFIVICHWYTFYRDQDNENMMFYLPMKRYMKRGREKIIEKS